MQPLTEWRPTIRAGTRVVMTHFDIEEINKTLADVGLDGTTSQVDLLELVDAVRTGDGQRLLRQLISDAALDQLVQVDIETAAQMVHPYTWLLEQALVVRQRSAVRVGPAQQPLNGDDLAVDQLRQRLVVQDDLAGLPEARHGSSQPATNAMDGIAMRVEPPPLALAAALDAV